LSLSDAHQVALLRVPEFLSGNITCEVSIEEKYTTEIATGYLFVLAPKTTIDMPLDRPQNGESPASLKSSAGYTNHENFIVSNHDKIINRGHQISNNFQVMDPARMINVKDRSWLDPFGIAY
ncbi:uncharacterized protein LOC113390911, partial [Ctenocephalides felis]|uniref:uncharacterized protein LOC113390911 n=1 Tax=Ctenocephalides felis TaxID=7515 RepID=UPI000E6E1C68